MKTIVSKLIPRKKNRLRTSLASKIFDVCNYRFMLFFCALVIYPIWEMIVISFSDPTSVSHISINLWPDKWVLDSYKYCLRDAKLLLAFRNTIARTLIGTVWHLLLCSMAAFALTRDNMPFRSLFMTIFVITMFFSGGLIPTYLNMKTLGMMDNFLVYILPGGFSIYNTIIIRNYFFSIDKSLEESAAIDGATAMQTMFKIILPLSKPVLATVGLWTMVSHWNSYFDNMVYCRDDSLITLQYMLKSMQNAASALQNDLNQMTLAMGYRYEVASETVIAASTVIIILPIICTYPFLQKYFVKGVMLGAVKG